MIKAIINKRYEILASLAMVLFLVIIASILMYLLEHNAQPLAFPNIQTSMWWGIDKYLTAQGGDAFPITPAGKFLGGFIAILGVGMFALPAGIIASGFIEEVERSRLRKELIKKEKQLKDAFFIEYFAPVKNAKKKIGLSHIPRKWLSLNDIKYKIGMTESSVIKVVEFSNLFRLRNVKLNGVDNAGLEFINLNNTYGQVINRNSNVTIVNLYASIQPYFGHFSYGIADKLQANYISNEVFSTLSFLKENQINMVLNESYVNASDMHPILNELTFDLRNLITRDSVCVLFVNAASNENLMQFNVGAEKGDHTFENGSFFSDKKTLNKLFSKAETLGVKYNMKVLRHGTVGNPGQNHISNFITQELNCDLLMLHVNVGILKKKGKEYYQHMDEFAGALSLD
ncbi:MAG TPA: hypothetical protein DCL52_06825 [Flavobacteriaceae bacterium]|nr:hypothetical protein [Flavobacteriaceae bacterium]|tara:strand:- start:292 stop:1491 length:1200 start_codon:yes stop_codon:yes gene_type:complete